MELVSQIFQQLGVNQTFFLNLAVLMVAFPLVTRFLTTPLFEAYQKRHEMTVGARTKVGELNKSFQTLLQDYDTRIQKTHAEAQSVLEKAVLKGQEENHKKMTQVREEAARIFEEERKKNELEMEKIRKQLASSFETIVTQMTGKLM